jgi:hypothetical protein
MLRLGNGEYESVIEGREPPSVHHARDVFLMTLSGMLPEVLRDLERNSLEYYRKSGLHFDDAAHRERLKHLNQYDRIREMTRLQQHHRWSSPEWRNFEEEEITYDQSLSALQKSIFQWSRKWRLDASWCRERAFHTLDYWCSYPDSHKNSCGIMSLCGKQSLHSGKVNARDSDLSTKLYTQERDTDRG